MPNYDPSNPYLVDLSVPSLAAQKSLKLSAKFAEKQEKITPTPQIADFTPLLSGDASSSGIFDMAEASIYRSGGNIADMARHASNSLLGTDYQDTGEAEGWSNPLLADEMAGVTPEYRQQYQEDIQSLSESVEKREILDSLGKAALLGPRALADSTGTLTSLAAGTVGTGGLGLLGKTGLWAGKKLLGIKSAKKAADTVKNIPTLGSRLKNGAKAVAKTTGRTSLMTADITEQMRQEYIAEHGKEPSASWYAVNVPTTIMLNAIEFGIITKLAPKFPKNFKQEMKEAVQVMRPSHRKRMAKHLGQGLKNVLTAAGAEAGQEYLQTWHEILASGIKGGDLSEITTAALREIGLQENQIEAVTGSLLGASAGGTARGIASAPIAATQVTVDTAKGVTKHTANAVKDTATRQSYKLLSQEERDVLKNQYETDRAVADQKIENYQSRIDAVEKATTLEELRQNEEVAKDIDSLQKKKAITDMDLNDPKALKKLQNTLLRDYASAKDLLNFEVETSRAGRAVTKVGKNVKDKSVEKAKEIIGTVSVEKVITTAKTAGVTAINAIKNIESSSALGIIEKGLTEGDVQFNNIMNAAKDLSLDDLKRTHAVLKEKNPKIGEAMDKLIRQKEDALTKFGSKSNKVTTEENLPQSLKDISEDTPVDSKNAAIIARDLNQVLNGEIGNLKTLKTLRKALRNYKNSDAYKNQEKGALNATNIHALESKLEKAQRRLLRPPGKRIISAVKKIRKAAGKKFEKFTSDIEEQGAKEYFANKDSIRFAAELLEATGVNDLIDKIKASIPDIDDIDAVVEKAEAYFEEKPEISEKANKALSNIANILEKTPEKAKALIVAIPDVVAKLEKENITAENIEAILNSYPVIKKSREFYKALLEQMTVKEDETIEFTDDHPDKQSNPVASEEKIKEAYNKLNPAECKI